MDITSYLLGKEAGGGGTVNLQSKSVTITENTTTNISPDAGYDGLSSVSVITNVSTGGEPTKGFTVNEWSNDGYPTSITLIEFSEIPSYYFYCYNTDVFSKLTTLNFKNVNTNLTSFGGYSFMSSNVTSINLPNTVTTIKAQAFNGSQISSITFNRAVNIGATFQYQTGNSFLNCSKLTSINLPSGSTLIGANNFKGCSLLETIVLPSNITTIDNSTFYDCVKLSSINLDNITTLINMAFYNCKSLILTALPSSLTTIGEWAFRYCEKITVSTIPDGVTSISIGSFGNCIGIKKISMNNVTTLSGNSAINGSFTSCTGLKKAWIGSAITSAGFSRYAFAGCTNLDTMYIDLPRATVEAFTNYQYAFMNDTSKTGIIVCNDDAGFINKTTFDALVVE